MKNISITTKYVFIVMLLSAINACIVGYLACLLGQAIESGKKLTMAAGQTAFYIENAQNIIQDIQNKILNTELNVKTDNNAASMYFVESELGSFNKYMQSVSNIFPQYTQEVEELRRQGDQIILSHVCMSHFQGIQLVANKPTNINDQSCVQDFGVYLAAIQVFHQDIIDGIDNHYGDFTRKIAKDKNISIYIFAFSVLIFLIFSFLSVRNSVALPLISLSKAIDKIREKDLSFNVKEVNGYREIQRIARTIRALQTSGIEQLQTEQAIQKAALEAQSENAEYETAQAERAVIQTEAVGALAVGLEKLAAGDIAFRITLDFDKDYDVTQYFRKLKSDFNKAADKLQNAMQHIFENADSVYLGATEITKGTDDLSRRTEQQAASLEETAAALDEITATVKHASESASEARKLANEAKVDAESSGKIVNKTIMAMGEIESSSKKISNIIGVIDEIAFQTSLLALNAGVEAARAGEAGRGFAVVATEVRALAQRSAEAAKEIKILISASSAQVQTGVRLVDETGLSLGRIAEQVTELNGLITDIANSSSEQSAALGGVNSAVNQMDQVTQRNAAMVEESTAASHSLVHEAEDLKRLVAQFKIR